MVHRIDLLTMVFADSRPQLDISHDISVKYCGLYGIVLLYNAKGARRAKPC